MLNEARDKWYDIGIQIHIPILTLKDIREKCSASSSASSDALRDMLVFCCTQRKTRLVDFIEALRSPAIDLQVCAKNLEALVENLCLDEGLGEFLLSVTIFVNNHYESLASKHEFNMSIILTESSNATADSLPDGGEQQYPIVRVCIIVLSQ